MFRTLLAATAALAFAVPALAQDYTPSNPECIAPAGAGGGWDFTCRQVGKTMQDIGAIDGTLQVTNMAGGGGGVAFAEVVNKRDDDDDLIVAASTATATRLAQGAYPGNTQDEVRWLGAVGADYGVIGVAADSEIADVNELFAMIKEDPSSIAFGGGSAVGGWDHLKVLLAAQEAGIEDVRQIKYVAFDGGGEAMTQLLGGSLQAFTGDASEAIGFVQSGDLKVLAVLAPERLEGELSDVPTAQEQGLDVTGANWRGFYGPGDMSDEAYTFWTDAIAETYASDEWKTVMEQNGLAPLDSTGEAFQQFVADSVTQVQDLSREIGLIQ